MASSHKLRISALERELAALRAEATTVTTTTTTRTPWAPGPTPRSPTESLTFLDVDQLRAHLAEYGFAHQVDIDRMVDRVFGAVRESKGEGQGDKGKGKIALRVASSGGGASSSGGGASSGGGGASSGGGGGGDGPQSKKWAKK